MFKKSLVLLTATAFMLPAGYTVNVVSADEYSAREARQERARQSRPKAKSTYKQRAPRQRASSSSRRSGTKSSYQREEQAAKQQTAPRKVSSPQQPAIPRAISRASASSGGGQQAGVQTRRVTRTTRGSSQPTTRTVRRTSTGTRTITGTTTGTSTGNTTGQDKATVSRTYSNVTKTRAVHPRAVGAKGDTRRTPRNATRSTSTTSRSGSVNTGSSAANQHLNRQAAALAYDRELYNRGTYSASRSNRDTRRAVRSTHGGSGEYYTQGKTRRLDQQRGQTNANWDRGRVRDYARGSYKRNWYRNSRYRDWDVYFGFSPFYYGFGYNRSYFGGHYNGYYTGHYYGRNYYYGHWPFTAGYYHARASWGCIIPTTIIIMVAIAHTPIIMVRWPMMTTAIMHPPPAMTQPLVCC
ncbi:MAG: hypothetical protein JKY34_14920 [Kordiimonadaceae bacterium]|nr:hypothetical protein [Kordiimonadaceae bacterium]